MRASEGRRGKSGAPTYRITYRTGIQDSKNFAGRATQRKEKANIDNLPLDGKDYLKLDHGHQQLLVSLNRSMIDEA